MVAQPLLRLLEHYPSVQGECGRVGMPTQFVRFAGCNLRCPDWGCDTQEAIQPHLFMREMVLTSVSTLVAACLDMRKDTGANNICLTGGEPALQGARRLEELSGALYDEGFTIEMFSNGYLPYTEDLVDRVAVVLDWKLRGSGEDRPKDEVRDTNWTLLQNASMHAIKFTIATRGDLDQALQVYRDYDMDAFEPTTFVAPVWDKTASSVIVKFVLDHQLPWRLSIQTHKVIWAPNERKR